MYSCTYKAHDVIQCEKPTLEEAEDWLTGCAQSDMSIDDYYIQRSFNGLEVIGFIEEDETQYSKGKAALCTK